MHAMPIAVHGYGANFVLSTLDRGFAKDLSLEEAKDLLKKCINELSIRFLIHQPNWTIKVADKDGVKTIEL